MRILDFPRRVYALSLIFLCTSGAWLLGGEGEVVEEVLPNGLRVILKEVHTSPIVSVWSWYDVGSRDEGPGVTGLAHFLEHMNFKGTEGISSRLASSRQVCARGHSSCYRECLVARSLVDSSRRVRVSP